MSNSVFKDCEPLKEDTMVILVNHDGSISVDHNSLQSLLTNKTASTSINVVRVSNNENTGTSHKDSELEMGVDNDDNSSVLPEVHFTLENYYSPEETRTIATNIMNFQGDVPVNTPLSLDTTDFNLFVIKNDHCYTPLTSPSQKLPVHVESPCSKTSDDSKRLVPTEFNKSSKEVKRNLYSNKLLSKSINNQSEIHQQKATLSVPIRRSQELQNDIQTPNELQSLLEGEDDDFDSEHIPSSESMSSDDGSDADFNIHDRKSGKLKRGVKGLNKGLVSARTKSVKKIKRRKSNVNVQHMEVESMLQAMEGSNADLAKPVSRRTSTINKNTGEKKLKSKPIKLPKVNKTEKISSPLDIPKPAPAEQILSDISKTIEDPKAALKVQTKKDKKPPAHVTEALFSDMTSLFSTPDLIKKVPTPPGRLSIDQRKSTDNSSETSPLLIKSDKTEKRKQSKDSLSDFVPISPKENAFNLCETSENTPKHLDFIDNIINGSNFSDPNSSLSVPPITSLPSLASILQASGATEAETNMDDATLLSNVVGVSLLESSNKAANPLEAVSIQALTSDIPDSGPLSAVSAGSLDLEENTLLESLHNVGEDISEDFLMHITQTLVENSDIKAVIDKQLENPTQIEQTIPIASVMPPKPKPIESPFVKLAQAKLASKEAAMARKEPIQIVRADGRVITLPPIEAPATRSKRKSQASTITTDNITPVNKSNPPSLLPPKIENLAISRKMEAAPGTVKKISQEVTKKRIRSNSIPKPSIHSLPESEDEDDDSDAESWRSEDDPDRLWCICQQPHNNRFMICCDKCEDWFHGKCVNVTKAMGQQMEEQGIEWSCPNCIKKKAQDLNQARKGSPNSAPVDKTLDISAEDEFTSTSLPVPYEKPFNPNLNHTTCIVCKKEARASSIYCSDSCILKHAQVSLSIISKPQSADKDSNKCSQISAKSKFQNIIKTKSDRVIVYERTTGRCLAGDSAPTVENLEQWLKENPTFEVVLKSGPNQPNIGKRNTAQMKNFVDVRKGTPVKINQINLNNKLQKSYSLKTTPQKQIVLIQPAQKNTTPVRQTAVGAPKPAAKTSLNQNKINSNKTNQVNTSQNVKTLPPTPVKTPVTKGEKPRVADTEPIRMNVKKTLREQLILRSNESADNKWSHDDIKKYCDDIEMEMFNLFKDTDSKYKAKYRSLLFNIKDKKNFTLYKKICEGDITPKQLVRLSPDELASQELAQWRAKEAKHQLEMIKKSELDLLACAKTYVLKTHKGEEIMESRASDMTEVDPTVAVEDVVSALNSSAVSSTSEPPDIDTAETPTLLDRHKLKNDKNKSHDRVDHKSKNSLYKEKSHRSNKSSHSTRSKDKNRDRSRDKHSDRHTKRDDKDKKLSTDNRSHQKRNSKGKSPENRRESSRRKSERDILEKVNKSKGKKEDFKEKEYTSINESTDPIIKENIPPVGDNTQDVDLKGQEDSSEEQLAEGETYQEPTSTVTEFYGTEPSSIGLVEDKDGTEVWNGVVNMVDVAHFGVLAFQISGDCRELAKDLPAVLDIVGRIGFATVWEYIAKMKTSNTKDIIVIQLTPINEDERVPYVGLYTYLSTRKRLGVIKQTSSAIKDFYIYPLGKKDSIPSVLLPLSVNENSKDILPNTLLGIIVRARRKRTANMLSLPMPTNAKVPRKLPSPPGKLFGSSNKRITDEQGYTPPTSPRPGSLKKLLPSINSTKIMGLTDSVKEKIAASLASSAEDEPYSPGGSDNGESDLLGTSIKSMPGADVMYIPSEEPAEIEKRMEELNRRIAEQKKQIQSMSAGIIGTTHKDDLEEKYSPSRPVTPDNPQLSALDNISLPSNLQEILASIQNKTASQSLSSFVPVTIGVPTNIVSEEKYSPSAPSSYLIDKQEFDLPINSQQGGYNLGIKNFKNQIVGQPSSDVSLYTNKDNVPNLKALNPTDVSLNLPISDIDERKTSQIFDVDERIAFNLTRKDVDERFPTKIHCDEIPLINSKPVLISSSLADKFPLSPIISKQTSKLAQLSEEELLSMVPDDILSNPNLPSIEKSNSSNNSDSIAKPICTISQNPVLYSKPPPVMLKDISFSQATAELPIPVNAGTSKRPNLEQPPPPGMESFFDDGGL